MSPLALTVGLLLAGPAWAHAFLKSATPPVGSVLQAAPAAIVIFYTEAVEPQFSSIEVQNGAGTRVDAGDVQLVGSDHKALTVSLKPLGPGTYKVIWHATSTDTHKTQGDYSFTVRD